MAMFRRVKWDNKKKKEQTNKKSVNNIQTDPESKPENKMSKEVKHTEQYKVKASDAWQSK